VPASKRGHRIVVDPYGYEITNEDNGYLDLGENVDA
jgi:hypothetical protein